MSTRIEVTLPDDVYRSAERLAQLTSRPVADVLAETLALSLPALNPPTGQVVSVTDLSDKDVLALAESQLPPEQDHRLSLLLDAQQAGTLTEADRSELYTLMQLFRESLLRKSQALHEAVRRGLREPLEA